MKHAPSTLMLLFVTSCASYVPEEFAAKENRVILYAGQRALDGDLNPVEDHFTTGLEYSRSWHSLAFEIGFSTSEDSSGGSGDFFETSESFDSTTDEYYVGVRKDFGGPAGRLHPYLGAGLALLTVDFESVEAFTIFDPPPKKLKDEDTVLGTYLHGGFIANLGAATFLGLDYRLFVGEDASLLGDDVGTGYGQLAFTFGFTF